MVDASESQVIREVLAGDSLSRSQTARLIPSFRNGKPTHIATIWRWASKGILLRDGKILKLETCLVGGRQLTSRAALGRFIAAQTPHHSAEPTPAPRTPTQQQRSSERASAALDKIGI